jgi:integrase
LCFGIDRESASVVVDRLAALEGSAQGPLGAIVRIRGDPERADLPAIRFHDLRHTAASLLLNAGAPLAEVSRMLGHASPHITYQTDARSVPSAQRLSVDTMEKLLSTRQA